MKSITSFTAAALVTLSMYTGAWWASPYGYNGVYAPAAPMAEEPRRQATTDQQAKAVQDAVEAQRKYAEQFTARRSESYQTPSARRFLERPVEITARRDQVQRQIEARRAEIDKRVAEQREPSPTGRSLQVPSHVAAYRDQIRRQIEARRAEIEERVKKQRELVSAGRDLQVPAYVMARRHEIQQQVEARRTEMKRQLDEQREAADEQQAATNKVMVERHREKDI